jgi:4-amino-4-deoxy-L-arabinose transferase-like glycosyltransferase
VILVVDLWYRAHTFGPTIAEATGFAPWPACSGASEPLDCDEAAYAYMGHRMVQGDVLYRDLTENKPPLGYWLYALGVAVGGYNELAIRLLPVPAILLSIVLIWWIAGRLAGPLAACLAAGLYVVLSTDPYLFGNGSNLEHFMNLFSVASLALFSVGWRSHGGEAWGPAPRGDDPACGVPPDLWGRALPQPPSEGLVGGCGGAKRHHRWGWRSHRRWPLVAAGACLAASTLVKQVAVLPAFVYAAALLLRRGESKAALRQDLGNRARDLAGIGLGFAVPIGAAALILLVQGAGAAAYEDIFQYGRALATDTLPEPSAPSGLVRWLTGNADPAGQLPWPFGSTDYLVWWGAGSWPLWLAAVPALLHLATGPGATACRRLVAAWTIITAFEVVLPGLYWQHYYLLPTPGIALAVAITLADCLRMVASNSTRSSTRVPRLAVRVPAGIAAILLFAAIGATVSIQVKSYLLVAPEELTVRYKGGRQWVTLRALGKELALRTNGWKDPRLYIWGWQSPLHFYGKLDGASRLFFVDNLLRDQAERDHPLIQPRIAEITRVLKDHPPALIFVGYTPFPALRELLHERYLPSRLVPSRGDLGLWVESGRVGQPPLSR